MHCQKKEEVQFYPSQYSYYSIFSITHYKNCLFYLFTVVKPEKHELLRLLYPITGKWQEIGELLGVDVDTIDSLYTSSLSNQVKMSKMLQSWLDNEPTPASWDNILDIIEGPLQKRALALGIRQKLKISKQLT